MYVDLSVALCTDDTASLDSTIFDIRRSSAKTEIPYK